MSANKSDEQMSNREFNDYHKTIFITTDIKNIVLITHIIRCREIQLDFSQIAPLSTSSNIIPALKGGLGIPMALGLVKLDQPPMRYNPHDSPTKLLNYFEIQNFLHEFFCITKHYSGLGVP